MTAAADGFLRVHPEFAGLSHAGREAYRAAHPAFDAQWLAVNGYQGQWGQPIGTVARTASSPSAAAVPAAVAAPAAPSGYNALGQTQKDWVDELTATFRSNGLETLAAALTGLVQQGYSGAALDLKLQDTDAYKTRFAGNAARKAAGKPVLSERDYLSTEAAYGQALDTAGITPGLFDRSHFAEWIGADKSVAEINGRLQAYVKVAANTNAADRALIKDQFGIDVTDGDIASYMLSPDRALPLLQKTVNAVGISEAARQQGLTSSAARSLSLTDAGVTDAQAQAQMGNVAAATHDYGRAAAGLGSQYDQTTAEDEALLGLESAKRKREQLKSAFDAVTATQTSRSVNKTDSAGSY